MNYDVIVIGGGPGGYVAAIRLAQSGKKVACIDKRDALGGTCLNVGCIPSKVLLEISHMYHDITHKAEGCGIKVGKPSYDLKAIMKTKDTRVASLTSGIGMLFKKNKIDFIKGSAAFIDKNTVSVDGKNYMSENFIIATGSVSSVIPNIEVNEKNIVSSTGALSLAQVPQKMIVIGGGYIGLELGSVYQRLGTQVEVIEYMDTIVPAMDKDVSPALKKILEKQGMTFRLGTKVNYAKEGKRGVEVGICDKNSDKETILTADVVLLSVGRKPYTDGLNLEKIGINITPQGFITVNDKFQTAQNNIYAIGDVIGGAMLAHKASDEAVVAADAILNKYGHINYSTVPGVIYTHPEVAAVGKTEQQLIAENVAYKVGKFPLIANSRAKTVDDTEGFVKILSCAKTDRVLGGHIIGRDAGNLIHEIAVVMEFSGSAEDLAMICHAHPTYAEAIKEAALNVEGKAIHI